MKISRLVLNMVALFVGTTFLPVLHAQYSNDFQTIVIDGVTNDWPGDFFIGNTNSADALQITNAGTQTNNIGALGYGVNSSSNVAIVSGTNSVWRSGLQLRVGSSGSANQLIITNGGTVLNEYGYLAYNGSSSNNVAIISGPSSVWNSGNCFVGWAGPANQMRVTDGGTVADNTGFVGYFGSQNTVEVNGAGSVWTNTDQLVIGQGADDNFLLVTNGGAVFDNNGVLGNYTFISSQNNRAIVSGVGSIWQNYNSLFIGDGGADSLLTVADGGTVTASNAVVGAQSGSVDCQLLVTNGGVLTVTNSSGTGTLEVRRGTLQCDGGTVLVENLTATNMSAEVSLAAGLFDCALASISNAALPFLGFVVGSGLAPAEYHMRGGTHTFADILRIRSNGTLTGCGTVVGPVNIE